MGIHQKSKTIDLFTVKQGTQLKGQDLAKKEARDRELVSIIKGEDNRLLLIIGPCSSDNEEAVLEYAKRLAKLQEEVKDRIFMVMRVYTAKPRTNGDGYKGLIHQPNTHGIEIIESIRPDIAEHHRLVIAKERVHILTALRLPPHKLECLYGRRPTVDIVPEEDQQILRIVERNLHPQGLQTL